MRIDSPATNPAMLLQMLGKSSAHPAKSDASSLFSTLTGSANSAASGSILPAPAANGGLSFDSILALQRVRDDDVAPAEPPSAADLFLREARKTPMERMREQILDSLGLTENALAAMSPEERRATEDRIREMIEEKLRQAMGAPDKEPDSNAQAMVDIAP